MARMLLSAAPCLCIQTGRFCSGMKSILILELQSNSEFCVIDISCSQLNRVQPSCNALLIMFTVASICPGASRIWREHRQAGVSKKWQMVNAKAPYALNSGNQLSAIATLRSLSSLRPSCGRASAGSGPVAAPAGVCLDGFLCCSLCA